MSRKENEKNKKRVWNRFYLFRLFARFFVACYFFGVYLTNMDLLDVSGFPKWIGMYIICGFIFAEILLRFFPFSRYPAGMKKYRRSEFIPTQAYKNDPHLNTEDLKTIRKMNIGLFKGCLFYFGITAVFYVLYFIGIIGVPELFLLMLAYWVGDMICVNLFCPFKAIMKNRCCTDCRIYNWDGIFLVIPLAVVPGLLSWGLFLIGAVYTFVWELNFHLHPERFLERTNQALKCEKCPKDLCPRKRKQFLKSLFSKE